MSIVVSAAAVVKEKWVIYLDLGRIFSGPLLSRLAGRVELSGWATLVKAGSWMGDHWPSLHIKIPPCLGKHFKPMLESVICHVGCMYIYYKIPSSWLWRSVIPTWAKLLIWILNILFHNSDISTETTYLPFRISNIPVVPKLGIQRF